MLASPADLRAKHQALVIDTRSAHLYLRGHIPGAVSLPSTELERTVTLPNGRRAEMIVLPPEELAGRLAQAGVTTDLRVVLYDGGGDSLAARVWWMLDYLRHPAAAVLDGGLEAWLAEGGDLSQEPIVCRETRFEGRPDRKRIALYEDLMGRPPSAVLCNTLSHDRFQAESIPGSRNLPFDNTFTSRSPHRLLSAADLDRVLTRAGVRPEGPTVFYCGAGYTASQAYYAARVLGYERISMYDGSLADWRARGGPLVGIGVERLLRNMTPPSPGKEFY
jgi:thiosulfate/3-mercaptopyruvate sulfurtransferase